LKLFKIVEAVTSSKLFRVLLECYKKILDISVHPQRANRTHA